jgi:hypothetical protein
VVGEKVHEKRRTTMEDGLEAGQWAIYSHVKLHLVMRDLVKAGLNLKVNSSLSPMLVLAAPFDSMGPTNVSLVSSFWVGPVR